ncbi:MAG: Sua5/YciO/YrdC/YwlC family protein, partial [Synechococcus sp.]
AFWLSPPRPDPQPQPLPGDPIEAAASLLLSGGILALQGVGGFQLLVDATAEAAVQRLRRRKRRPAKPLALLVADPAWVEGEVWLGAAERRALADPAAPIVLLSRREPERDAAVELGIAPGVAPGSPALGVMLPASPLHRLLSLAVGRPLVATSGNPSGEPLCLDPAEAVERLGGIADAFLVHNRPIARRLDDSVLQLIEGRPALLRRARGYAPEALPLAEPPPLPPDRPALALGGDLKAAPALAAGGRVWLAPHLGDLNEPRSLARLRQGLEETHGRVRQGNPHAAASGAFTLLCDAHPDYRSSCLAAAFTAAAVAPVHLRRVPHHLAHGLAVLAEHGLGASLREAPVLVLACDGLGAGPSPEGGLALWGCELLRLEAGSSPREVIARRLAALRPFPLPGGEKAAAEPRRSALGLLAAAALLEHPGAATTCGAFSVADRVLLQQAVAAGCNSPWSSSLGRLFDAMASLLDLCQRVSFEGEGGLALQALAAPAWPADPLPRGWRLPLVPAPAAADLPLGWLDWQPLLEAVLGALPVEEAPGRGQLAAAFHAAVIEALVAMANAAAASCGARRVLLAGGCFQNRLLLEGCAAALRAASLVPHWGEAVPANDGGLALGQLWAVSASLATTKTKPTPPPQRAHVPGPAWSHPLDRAPSPQPRSGGPG